MAKDTLYRVDKNLTKITIQFSQKEHLSDFYNFLLKSQIYPTVRGNSLKDMYFEGFFSESDASKIIEHLKEKKYRKCQILPS